MPLYAFGSNGSGQLGLGHKDDVSIPAECLFKQAVLTDSQTLDLVHPSRHEQPGGPVHIAAGGNHTLALFSSGEVWTAGSNANGRCAQAPEVEEVLEFRRVRVVRNGGNDIDRFSAVAATWESSCFVEAETEAVWVVGMGWKGELGLGENVTEVRSPTKIPNFPPQGTRIMSISGGMGHVVVALSNGDVFGWGNVRKGQLGEELARKKIVWSPEKVNVPFAVKQVVCGREFTAFGGDTEKGDFTVFGSDKWSLQSKAPQSLKGYKRLFASWSGIYSHQSDGSVIAWGRNDRGQLPPHKFPKVILMAAGSEHVVAVTDDKKLVAFGWGEHGNCGPETDQQGNVVGSAAEIPFGSVSGITSVGAGCATSWLMAD